MSAAGSSAPSLSNALSAPPIAASFSIQPDWESVLREWSAVARGPTGSLAAAEKLPKESRQFWISAARFGEDGSQREAIAQLEDGSADLAASAAAASAAPAANNGLAAAARSVRLNTAGPNSTTDIQLQFRTPLQVMAHSESLHLSQLMLAPRATYSKLHPQGDVLSVDINAQGTMGLSAGADNSVRVWDATSGALKSDLVGHVGDVHLVRWFPSGSVALSAGLDLAVKIWAVEPTVALAAQLVGHTRPVTSVNFLGRGRHLVTSSEDGSCRLWDVSRGSAALANYPAHKDLEAFAPKIHEAIVLDPTAHECKMTSDGGLVDVPDAHGNLLLTGSSDGMVRGYDLRSQGQVFMLPSGGARAGGIEALCKGPIPNTFTLGTTEGPIAVVDLRNKQSVAIATSKTMAPSPLQTIEFVHL